MTLTTTDRDIFKQMDNDSLQRNHEGYKLALMDPRLEAQRGGYEIGLSLCVAEMERRGLLKRQTA